MADYDIGAAFAAIEDELIASMMKNFQRHRAEELAEGFDWAQWQAEMLDGMEAYKRRNAKKYGAKFRSINRKLGAAIRTAYADGGADEEESILDAARKGFSIRTSVDSGASFFKVNARKLDALVDATTHDLQRAEVAILRQANDQYRKIIFNAQVYANSGAGTYGKAVDMATKDFLAAGIQCIEYRNGSRHTVSDYADMCLKTATKRAYLAGEGAMRQDWGISTVIMNKRTNACPHCAKFAGRIFIDDVWSGGKQEDGDYPLLSEAIAQGLYHPRCKDSHTTYFEGITEVPEAVTEDELKRLEELEGEEVKRQYTQRMLEKYERLAQFSLDAANQKRYNGLVGKWKAFLTPAQKPIRIDLGVIGTAWDPVHGQNIESILKNAPEKCRKVWNECASDFHLIDPAYQGPKAHYSPRQDGVLMDIARDAKGTSYQNAYRTTFHEFGHHCDYILNRSYGNANGRAFSETYKGGIFGKTLKQEANAAIDDWARANGYVFKNGNVNRSKAEPAFCAYIKGQLSMRQRSDISDMFEPVMARKNAFPFSFGHGTDYWKTRDNGKEGFAEMFSASIAETESLDQIKRFFPKSYGIFIEMLEVVK